MCLALVMVLMAVLGMAPGMAAWAAEPESYTFEVEAELGAEGNGQWNTSVGEETDSEGNEVTYASFPGQWNNGRYIVNFPYAGTYKMQLRIAVPTKATNVHLEVAPEGGSFTSLKELQYDPTATANTYVTADAWEIDIEEAGNYDLKFGCWAAGCDFKVDKFIFTCDSPVAPPSVDEPLEVKKGGSLVLKESLAFHKNGSLKNSPSAGDSVDYMIKVNETGDYTLAYSIAANSAAVEDAFQICFAENKEDVKDADFTTKLAPVQLTRYYSAIEQRQSVHLEAGEYILRTKALNEGFSLTQLTLVDMLVHELSVDAETPTVINAVDCNDGDMYYAIENNGGDIGYAANGLTLKYEVTVTEGGIYNLVYHYAASSDSSLSAQRMTENGVVELAESMLDNTSGSGNWYDAGNYRNSEAAAVLLPAGTYTFCVHWNSADINLKTMTFTYAGSAVEYVRDQLEALPQKDAMVLEDKAAVLKAKNSYDALTAEEKTQISDALVKKMQEDLDQIDVLELRKAKEDQVKELQKEFEKYAQEDYRAEKWQQVIDAKDAGIDAINGAASIADAEKACRNAKTAMAAVVKKLKAIVLSGDNTIILAQSKAYRKNGFLNSNVEAGNWADYYVDVQEAGEYTFTYALYSDAAVEKAFSIQYNDSENSEYPDEMTGTYAEVSVPRVAVEGNLVKEIRGTVSLKAGEQTIRFIAGDERVRLNRVTVTKKQAADMNIPQAGQAKVFQAAAFAEAANQYILASGVVTDTAAGTALDYPVALNKEMNGFISFHYAYAGEKSPVLAVSRVDADGREQVLATVDAGATTGEYADSKQAGITLPAGSYVLRVTMENDGVDLKSFTVSRTPEVIPTEGIALNVYQVSMNMGDTFKLTAIRKPENTTTGITWTSSDETVASVSEDGMITAGKNGKAVITAQADGCKAICEVTVGESKAELPVPTFIERVSVYPLLTTLYAGGDADKSAPIKIVVPTGAKLAKAEYAVSDKTVAEVSAAGMLTAKKAGSAVVTVKVALTNGETAVLQRQITVKKAYIKLKKSSYRVKKGKSITLKATAYGSSKKVSFKIKTGKKLAKVTRNGKFTGKKKGTVKVIAYAGKVKKTFSVKVK